MSKDKIRLGFVGTGGMGQMAHLRNYSLLPDCEVVAVSETREGLGARVAARYGVPKVYPDAAAMLAHEKLDGLVASQPFWRHGIVVNELLRTGLPLFIEKPLAGTLPVAEQLEAADRAAGGRIMIGYHKRSDPATIYAKAEIDRLKQTGELGKLRYVRVTMPSGDWVANGWLGALDAPRPDLVVDPEDPGLDPASRKAFFEFVNFYIHQINLIRHLAGENYRLSYVDPTGVVITGNGLVSGVPVVLEACPYTSPSDWQESALVAFEYGFVQLRLPAPLAFNRPGHVEVYRDPPVSRTDGRPAGGSTAIPQLPWDHAMRVQAQNFVKFCRGEAPPPCGAAEAAEDIRVARSWLKITRGV
jgi:predicted dehydrogenase